MTTGMTAEMRRIFKAAKVDTGSLTFVPRAAVHKFMVKCDAWLDAAHGLLMFVDAEHSAVAQFMYYIGEERNAGVVGIGRGIAAWEISEERVEWLQAQIAKYDHATATVKP